MRASSESIAQLASALAKAQLELINPAKTLTAVIDRWGTGNEGKSYRYAPLSAGLDIVRKTLCKHELAVIQTTHVDYESGFVLLTTTLAHGSGEWIAAAWPVCRTSDMSNPKLMGAALTYSRRYGLFTIVGLAGEDDLDGPSLTPENEDTAGLPSSVGDHIDPTNPEPPLPNAPAPQGKGGGWSASEAVGNFQEQVGGGEPARVKEPRASAGNDRNKSRGAPVGRRLSRDALDELARVHNPEALFRWALDVLPLRNKLAEAPRTALDAAFLARADALGADCDLLLPFGPLSERNPPEPLTPSRSRDSV